MKLSGIISVIEKFAPASYQEEYDNSGLNIGDSNMDIKGVLLCIDVTEETVEEAVECGANLIISHHPVIFRALKKITSGSQTSHIIKKAIKNDISIYCAHTSIDNVYNGVSHRICEKLGLSNLKILVPQKNNLLKLTVFVPVDYAENIRDVLFREGAGNIGLYDQCSFNTEGFGTFRASEYSRPFTGEKGKMHFEKEIRIETVFPEHLQGHIISSMLSAHPYEEVAYDIYTLENENTLTGSGMTGELTTPVKEIDFFDLLKKIFNSEYIRHSAFTGREIKKVAVCGGSGSAFIQHAIKSGSQVFVTADIKYHQFFEAAGNILLADIGHYESEQYTIEIFYEILTKNFPNIAVRFSKINTNPINYY